MPSAAGHHPLWIDIHPLVLASSSQARRSLLTAAGIPILVDPAQVDERALEAQCRAQGADSAEAAAKLARAKAAEVCRRHPGPLTLGADQILECDGATFSKPATDGGLRRQLRAISGRTHRLISAASLWRDGREVFAAVKMAEMTMRPLSEAFIAAYCDAGGAALHSCVGGYQVEGLGVHLFEAIVGDQSTILGLPLLPVLDYLRSEGSLLA